MSEEKEKYFINPFAVILLPEKDKENNYSTIVFNPQEERLLKVSRFGYRLLKAVSESSGISLEALANKINSSGEEIAYFINNMVSEKVLIKRNRAKQ